MAKIKDAHGESFEVKLTAGMARKIQNELDCNVCALTDEGPQGYLQGLHLNPLNQIRVLEIVLGIEEEDRLDDFAMEDVAKFTERLVVDFFHPNLRPMAETVMTQLNKHLEKGLDPTQASES